MKEKNKNIQIPVVIKSNNSKDKKVKFIIILAVILFLTMLFMFGNSMAKTIEQKIINANTKIAEPIFIIENDSSIDITSINDYGEYSFKIKNYNEKNKITDVDLKYYIEILSYIDETVSIELYKNDKLIKFDNNKTEYMQFSNERMQDDTFKIKIKYNKDNSTSINDIVEKIQIKVHSEQI